MAAPDTHCDTYIYIFYKILCYKVLHYINIYIYIYYIYIYIYIYIYYIYTPLSDQVIELMKNSRYEVAIRMNIQ